MTLQLQIIHGIFAGEDNNNIRDFIRQKFGTKRFVNRINIISYRLPNSNGKSSLRIHILKKNDSHPNVEYQLEMYQVEQKDQRFLLVIDSSPNSWRFLAIFFVDSHSYWKWIIEEVTHSTRSKSNIRWSIDRAFESSSQIWHSTIFNIFCGLFIFLRFFSNALFAFVLFLFLFVFCRSKPFDSIAECKQILLFSCVLS